LKAEGRSNYDFKTDNVVDSYEDEEEESEVEVEVDDDEI
jgi:hypothetical protein